MTPGQQDALPAASESARAFYLEGAKKDDGNSREVFAEAGVEIDDMTEEEFKAWQTLAAETSYKEFVASMPDGQKLLDMALAVE